jgi:two-component system CheB/CheR fusion protein
MVFKEAAEQVKSIQDFKLHIFATDLDRDTIDKARQGLYSAGIAADVTPERLKRFFVKEEGGYRIAREIREMVTFATQNVIMDSPFTKLDIIICRNLLIYLTPELQQRILSLFHYSLAPDGILFLGSSEAIGGSTDLFISIDSKSRLFRRRGETLTPSTIAFPSSFIPALPGVRQETTMLKPTVNIQSLADQVLLQRFSPPAVLVNNKGRSCRQRQSPGTGAGAATLPRGTADNQRRDAGLAGRAQILQRRDAVHQRRASVRQRGIDHLSRGDAITQRGTADGERRAAIQDGRARAGQ